MRRLQTRHDAFIEDFIQHLSAGLDSASRGNGTVRDDVAAYHANHHARSETSIGVVRPGCRAGSHMRALDRN